MLITTNSRRYWRGLNFDNFTSNICILNLFLGTVLIHSGIRSHVCYPGVFRYQIFSSVYRNSLQDRKYVQELLWTIAYLKSEKDLTAFQDWEEKEVSSSRMLQAIIPLCGCVTLKQDTDVQKDF